MAAWRLFHLFSARRRWQFAGVFAFTLVGAAAELLSIGAVVPFLQLIAAPAAMVRLPGVPAIMQWLGVTQAAELLWPAALLLMGTAAASAAVRIVLIWISSRYVYGLTHDLSMAVYERVILQPYALYVRRNTAEVLSGLEKVNYIGGYFLNPLMTALSSVIIAVGIVALLIAVDPFTALVTGGAIGVLYAVIYVATRRSLIRLGRRQADLTTQRVKLAQESLGGLRDIILDRSHDVFTWHYRFVDAQMRRISAITNFISLSPRYLVEGAGIVLIALLALHYAAQPGGVIAAIPVLGALALGAQRLLPLAQNISVSFVQYASTTGMVDDLLVFLDSPMRETALPLPAPAAARLSDRIEFDAVDFSYDGERLALEGVSLTIRKGARVGIIGRTGSGKSTLLDVFMGLLPVTGGQLLIDGRPLDAASLEGWQAQVAHVPQAIFLIDDTIAANIAFGVPAEQIDLTAVRDAAERADVAEFVAALPQGYLTKVGERGIRLSGGQRQRIGIARALYKKATVLVLDEATSALDEATERSVMAGIEQLDRDLTIVMIAHRLSTVAGCELIVRMDQGRVVEQGGFGAVVRGVVSDAG